MEEAINRFSKQLTAERRVRLLEEGYTVVDNAFGGEFSRQLRDEIRWLHAERLMEPNKVQFQTSGGPIVLEKPHIFEADMHDVSLRMKAGGHTPNFVEIFEADTIVALLQAWLPSLDLQLGQDHKTVKLQHNTGGGGCFPWHYDNPSRPNKRALTMLTYLNEDWAEGDGGELELMPFLSRSVVIPPTFDRVVLFLSDRILHKVRPASAPRTCFTLWLDSPLVNKDDEVFLRAKHLNIDAVPDLQKSPVQRVLSRAVYYEEYEKSLLDCFGAGSKAGAISLKLHQAHAAQLPQTEQVQQFVRTLRDLKSRE